MESENVELVRKIYASWERGDFSSTAWADPEIEFVAIGGLQDGSWRGITEMAKAWGEFLSAWDDLRSEAEEFREIDDERVLVLTQNSGRGKTSGLELANMQTPGANIFHIRDRRVTRLVIVTGRERAFAELNLPPESGPPQD